MLQILRSIELRLSPTGHGTVRHQRIISVVLFPDLWIPKIFPATSFRKHIGSNHRIVCKLMIGLSEVSPSPMAIACCCRIRESPSASVSSITSVHMTFLCLQRRTGEVASGIIDFIRCHRAGKQLPADDIIRPVMRPVHRSPLSTVWVVLTEQMIFSSILGKTVWVINPAHRSCHMERRTCTYCLLCHFCCILPCFFNNSLIISAFHCTDHRSTDQVFL